MSDDRTEAPTERRREDAREKGQVAKSQDLTGAALMLGVAAAVLLLFPTLGRGLGEMLTVRLCSVSLQIDQDWALRTGEATLGTAGTLLAPLLILAGLVTLGVNLAQVGVLLAPTALQPKLNRISPLSGFGRIVSVAALMKLGVSLAKLAALAIVSALLLWWAVPGLLALTGAEAGGILAFMHRKTAELALTLAVVLVALAVADYLFQLWKHERDLRMTKQEIRDEMKNMDGDPHIRQRRRDAHRKLTGARQLQSVKTADVVVTNPTHYAVALKYDATTMAAPTVVAKGVDELALQIRRLAAESGVPILERPPLARQLYRDIKVGRPIPVDLYEAFVEIMAYVYRLGGKQAANPARRRHV